ncbi:cupin [Candidatus Peregrinibacteria bacterium]|nr:cupin [Candidatus Peregrinibacteria bacterium]
MKKPIIKLKPWGREIWFAHTEYYAGKILEIKKGHRYSLQYHEKKLETQFVLKGSVKIEYGKTPKKLLKKILHSGEKIDILPWTIHRAEALTDATIFEVSTPELGDVVKIEDDYGRSGKVNNEKLDRTLSKNDSVILDRKVATGDRFGLGIYSPIDS